MKLKDAQQEFVDRLLESLGNGIIPWQSRWDQGVMKPINGVSGKPYRGVNQLNLWMKSLTSGFDDPRWLTFKQANELGCKIKKGSVGSNVYHYSFKDERTNKYVPYNEYVEMEPEEKEHIKTLTKVYKVFNGSQITGLEPLPDNERVVSFSNTLAADFVDQLQVRMGVNVLQHKSRAFYNISEDQVYVPDKSQFRTEQGYYATLLHEMAHASGHESRLNREFGTNRDSDQYAIEELKAELSSAFLSMEVGFSMDSDHEKNHQAYIQSWMRAIQNNQRVLFDAIKEASGIQSYLVETGRLNELKEKHKQELTGESEQRVQVQGTRPQAQLNDDEQILERQPATIEVDSEDLKEARSEEDIAKSILTKWNNEFPVPYHIVEADKGNYKVAIFDHPGKAEHYFQYRHALNEWVHDTKNEDSILQIEGLDNQEIDFLRKTYAVGIDNRVFVDMDGVLARFNNQISSMEVLYEKGYYSSLEPLENVVKAVSDLIDNADAEVYILSAVLDSEYAADEKREWLQKYLPKIDNDHIIFSEYGYPKSNYIPGGIKSNDVLLDDYTKNLDEWTAVGAKGIKLINDINDTNQSWKGMRVNYDDQDLSKVLFENIDRMQNSEGIVIPEEVEAEINELLTNEENDLSDSDRVAALQEFLHSEQEKLDEMMKVEQFYPNEKQILRQQEIVDNVLNQYNAAVAKSNKVRNDQEQIIAQRNDPLEINNKIINLDEIGYELELSHYLKDKEALIYLHMKTPVGHIVTIDGNGKELIGFEYKSLTDEEMSKTTQIYKPINSVDQLAEVQSEYIRGTYMMNPEFMTAQEAVHFHNVFEWLTNKFSKIIPDELVNKVQQELLDNSPMDYQKMMSLRDKYITNDMVQDVANRERVDVNRLHGLLGTTNRKEVENSVTQNQQQTTTKRSTVSLDTIKNSVSIAEYARDVLGMGLIKESRGMFRLDAHDSCKIYPNNTFYRFSQGVGGSIVDFIKHFQEVDTKEAIAILKQHYKESNPDERFNSGEKATNKSVVRGFDKDLEVPEKGSTNKNVYAYLTKTRGISADIVNDYLKRGLLYQDVNNNCVFVGRLDRTIHYAMVRGTGRGKFRQDVAGSVKEVGIYVENNSDTLIVNEAAIDQMSYQTLVQDPKAYSYLACNGASNVVNAIRFHMNKRAEATNLNRVIIALDNDDAGIENTEKVVEYLKEDYPDLEVRVHLPENANDFNDQLKNELNQLKEMGMEQNISGSNLEMT
ncbi:5' nucleotidase, NT5C type [Breznakia pachnodae]|uniref:Antirestriction protein ArdC/5'(3')-deoxyribonucleotidase n=1 Tax=Breznakia pachnodae TaxID=265178 RepID=A0ABU0E8N5_9FIRM|nr:zincin-like metallopeptidase domain-containing protein [Breznakia pachnodae]MDQ0363249.1 antirestriction protein ArdC/5'(3')-deoxyribonucleotidase [Breznakia pachnodae]